MWRVPAKRFKVQVSLLPNAIVSWAPSTCHLHMLNIASCSIACFKQHKDAHSNHPKEPPTQPTQPAQTNDAPVAPASNPVDTLPGRSNKINFTGFESDPELLRLLSRYPNLRIQLQSVYGLTLEPPPPQERSYPFRGRGRGRGRPAFHQQSHWSQAKGDKEATDSFRNMRNAENDAQALTEFVQLLKMRFAPESDDSAT